MRSTSTGHHPKPGISYTDRVLLTNRCLNHPAHWHSFAGRHIRHITLSFRPTPRHAITVTDSGHLLVTHDLGPIYIYSLEGVKVATIQRQELELEGRGEWVKGIRYGSDGLLHLAAGDYLGIRSLHAYKVG